MTDKQPEALRLADELEMWTLGEPAAAELRRLHAENERLHQINQSHELKLSVRGYELQIEDLLKANEAFGKRQEWWNEKMFALEKQLDELLEALRGYVNDFSSEDGMYDVKHYVKVFGEVIASAEGKQ